MSTQTQIKDTETEVRTPPAITKSIKPAVHTLRGLIEPYSKFGWNRVDELQENAKQIAAGLHPHLKFEVADNLGKFMRQYWTLCNLAETSGKHIVPFCDDFGIIWPISLRDASEHIMPDDQYDASQEHKIFQEPMKKGIPLYVPALFGKYIPCIVARGGDAVFSCNRFTYHGDGDCVTGDALFVRLATMSKAMSTDIFCMFDTGWHKESK